MRFLGVAFLGVICGCGSVTTSALGPRDGESEDGHADGGQVAEAGGRDETGPEARGETVERRDVIEAAAPLDDGGGDLGGAPACSVAATGTNACPCGPGKGTAQRGELFCTETSTREGGCVLSGGKFYGVTSCNGAAAAECVCP